MNRLKSVCAYQMYLPKVIIYLFMSNWALRFLSVHLVTHIHSLYGFTAWLSIKIHLSSEMIQELNNRWEVILAACLKYGDSSMYRSNAMGSMQRNHVVWGHGVLLFFTIENTYHLLHGLKNQHKSISGSSWVHTMRKFYQRTMYLAGNTIKTYTFIFRTLHKGQELKRRNIA